MPPRKYDSDEEKDKAYKSHQNNYSKKDWKCDVCDCVINLGNKTLHLRTKKHFRNQSSTNGDNGGENECSYRSWKCDDCDIEISLHSKENHLKSKKHIANEWLGCLNTEK